MSNRIDTPNGKTTLTVADAFEYAKAQYHHSYLKWALLTVGAMVGFAFLEKTIEDNSNANVPGFYTKAETPPSKIQRPSPSPARSFGPPTATGLCRPS